MRKLFHYNFINKYVMSTYRLVELSAYYKKNVPHRVLLTAAFVSLGVAKFETEQLVGHALYSDRSGEFGRTMGKSQSMYLVRQCYEEPSERMVPLSAAWLKHRRPTLATLMNTPDNTSYASDTVPTLDQQPSFHRYTLVGQGLDHSLATPVRGLLNKLYNKGRTPRNKQVYRTGVF